LLNATVNSSMILWPRVSPVGIQNCKTRPDLLGADVAAAAEDVVTAAADVVVAAAAADVVVAAADDVAAADVVAAAAADVTAAAADVATAAADVAAAAADVAAVTALPPQAARPTPAIATSPVLPSTRNRLRRVNLSCMA
jgi:hypothetical protein